MHSNATLQPAAGRRTGAGPLPLVVCALRFEQRRLRRNLVAHDREWQPICCGPGADGVASWGSEVGTIDRPVILAGLAGACDDSVAACSARVVSRVIDAESGAVYEPTLMPRAPGHGDAAQLATVASARAPLVTPQAKRALGQRLGADLVDMESAAFARLATARGWQWAIVRGVSDGLHEALPANIARWVTIRGGTAMGSVLRDLLTQPRLLGDVRALRRRSIAAINACGGVLTREFG